jgi:hypothetical protein
MSSDPFETATIRARVLDSWAAAPVRFREDANLEEDLVLGGYRDRVVVELAQNAADAALRAGVPGRLHLSLSSSGRTLTAANTGSPLDAGGVIGLATLRASAKRDEEHPDSGPVGRFGVGFAAVLAVSDAPSVLSLRGGVRFSLEDAREMVELAARRSPELGDELGRREGRVPVLRLPFEADGHPAEGYDTTVVLPLRDEAAEGLVRRLLAELDDALMLALPALTEIVVEVDGVVRTLTATRDSDGVCTIADGERTTVWRQSAAHGPLAPELLADRPVEERARPRWSVTWAVPSDADGAPERPVTAAVIHAPTPTDEPLGLPALLITTLPLDPTRRHVAPGPLTDFLLAQAAKAYADLVARWPVRTPELLRLVPGPIAEGAIDAELRRRIGALLPDTRFLPTAEDAATSANGHEIAAAAAAGAGWSANLFMATDVEAMTDVAEGSGVAADQARLPAVESAEAGSSAGAGDAAEPAALPAPAPATGPIRPRDAVVIVPCDAPLVAALDGVLPGLLPAGFERDRAALNILGVRVLGLGELVDILAGLDRAPAWWGALYAALDEVAGHDPAAREALSALPVPLVDGRTVRGPRGTLRPVSGLDVDGLARLAPLGLRIVHPDAIAVGARLLERLGAQPAEPRAILADPAVFAAIDASLDASLDVVEAGPAAVAEAVLTLLRAANPRPGERFGLGALLLPDADDGFSAAADLLLPSSALAGVVDAEQYGFVDEEWVRRWGTDILHAAGVPDTFPLLRDSEVMLDLDTVDGDLLDLDGFAEWIEHVEDLLADDDGDGVPPVLSTLTAVADLDSVRPDAWPEALAMLARSPLREAVVAPAKLVLGDGTRRELPSHTSWWLSRHPVLGGRCPGDLVGVHEGSLAGLYDPVDPGAVEGLDPEFQAALGIKSTALALLATPGGPDELLDRLADPDRSVTRTQLTDLYCSLAEVPADQVGPPEWLRATLDGELVVAHAEDVVVVDAPDLLPLLAGRPYLPIPLRHALALADLLDLDLASATVSGKVADAGERLPVPPTVRALLPDAPETYVEHDDLVLDDGTEVDWRVLDGVVHTSTFDGLARGLAWAAGRWDQRHLVAAVLAEPERTADLLVEIDFE